MTHLEDYLHRLTKVSPSRRFSRTAKERLMHRIQLESDEQWFLAFLKRLSAVFPSQEFLVNARVRLMSNVALLRPEPGWLIFLRRFAVSTLIMVLAVGSTLFWVDSGQIVTASQDTYLKIISGPVTLKRADQLTWNKVMVNTDVASGDLIRVDAGGQALVHFFDETEVRLGENSLLLISQIYPSPSFNRQGVIEVSLHQGRAWVQTLNVDDGFAGFTLMTRDALVQALNSSFDVSTDLTQPTHLQVFRNDVQVQAFGIDRIVTERTTVVADNALTFTAKNLVKAIKPMTPANRVEGWITSNLQNDHNHLTALREQEFETLKRSVGVLPGQMMYPIKLAKERLQVAFSFGDDALTQQQIDIANKRLNEAVVLLGQGDATRARESLLTYQNLTRDLVETARPEVRQEISQRIITQNQKMLVASLPTDPPVRALTEALNATEELIAQDPLAKEEVRLKNAVDRLSHIGELVTAGDFEGAKAALTEHSLMTTDILDQIMALTDVQLQKQLLEQVLALRQKETDLLNQISDYAGTQLLKDPQLLAMLGEASEASQNTLEATIAFVAPRAPELVFTPPAAASEADPRVQEFTKRLLVYKTSQGQKNQLTRLFREQPALKWDVDFLKTIRVNADLRVQDMISSYILEAERQNRLRQHKAVQQKIDRAKKMRQTGN
ncbi:MAG: DUF5667 domain-containing protein [Candidatus Peregrinibacteria bacterium]